MTKTDLLVQIGISMCLALCRSLVFFNTLRRKYSIITSEPPDFKLSGTGNNLLLSTVFTSQALI